ncbi:MAG: hypothetical protein Q8P35_00045 [Candidatus Yanofskybacteria bacterium]|nr:hypothetical protein [Candidatus Yanofskybacteria bacterium]
MKSPVWIGFFLGSIFASLLSSAFGIGSFSLVGIFLSFLGGGAGIWLGYRSLNG